MSTGTWALPGLVLTRAKNRWRGYRRAGFRAMALYLKLRGLRWLGRDVGDRRLLPPVGRAVLFVCHGNIIRSPMAAALLVKHLVALGGPRLSVASAGLRACPSRAADARARTVAREFGVSLDGHRAAPLTREHLDRADVVFVMDHLNEAVLLARHADLRPKVFLLGALQPGRSGSLEIADPYHGDVADVRRCFEALDRLTGVAARSLARPRVMAGGGP